MNRRTVLTGIGLFLGSLWELGRFDSISGNDSPDAAERSEMAALAEDFRREFDLPALSLAIAHQGRLVYEEAFGTIAHTSREKATRSSLFRIASISKPITSSAIFLLVEKGLFHTDDQVFGKGAILGTVYGRQPYTRGIEQITVDHLLTHTSGGWDNGPDDPMFSNPRMSQGELISWTLDTQPLKHDPGTVFAYSNFGYCVLGRVIEKITGVQYAEFVKQQILRKCGIKDMGIAGNTLADRAENEVKYYGQGGDDPYGLNVTRMDSHGGWLATPLDLVLFASHVDGFDAQRNILNAETIRKMTAPGAVNPDYARGWRVNRKGHWWHIGSLPGTTGILVRTSSDFCWAALTNSRRGPEGTTEGALDDVMWRIVSKVSKWKP